MGRGMSAKQKQVEEYHQGPRRKYGAVPCSVCGKYFGASYIARHMRRIHPGKEAGA